MFLYLDMLCQENKIQVYSLGKFLDQYMQRNLTDKLDKGGLDKYPSIFYVHKFQRRNKFQQWHILYANM